MTPEQRVATLQGQVAIVKEDSGRISARLAAMTLRLRAAIVDQIEETGTYSPEHLRLRYALSGEGEGAPSVEALAVVARNEQRVRDQG